MAISTSSGEVYEDETDYLLGHSIDTHKDQPSPMGDKKSNNPVPMIWTHMEDLGTLKPTIRQDTMDDELGVKSLGVGPQSNRDLDRRTPPSLPMTPSPSLEPKLENRPHPPGYQPGQKLSSLVIRHGSTEDNAEDKNKPGERIRGWRDVPLSEQGRKEAEAAGDKLEHAGIDTIYTSDLKRARHTAEAIQETTGAPIVQDPGLRPWNLGNLQGKDVKEVKSECEHYVRNPDESVPGGESFNTFKDRFLETMDRLEQEPGKKAYVTHFRNTHVLKHIDENGNLDTDEFLQFDKNAVKPGGIMKLAMMEDRNKAIDLPAGRVRGESAGGSLKLERDTSKGTNAGYGTGGFGFSADKQSFNFTRDGKTIGGVTITPKNEGKDLHIEMIRGQGKIYEGDVSTSNSFGPSDMRSLLKQLKQQFPDAERLYGYRISGGRAKAEQEIQEKLGENWEVKRFGEAFIPLKPGVKVDTENKITARRIPDIEIERNAETRKLYSYPMPQGEERRQIEARINVIDKELNKMPFRERFNYMSLDKALEQVGKSYSGPVPKAVPKPSTEPEPVQQPQQSGDFWTDLGFGIAGVGTGLTMKAQGLQQLGK